MSSPQETKPSDEAIVPTAQPKRLIGESDSDDDDCDFQIIEPIPMETLDKDQKDALSLLASKGTKTLTTL
jgi:hypothetical protein